MCVCVCVCVCTCVHACVCVCVSGVRYKIFSCHNYCTQHITIRYISQCTTHHSDSVFTLMTLVALMYILEVQYNMVHDQHTTLQALLSKKKVQCTMTSWVHFSIKSIPQLISRYKDFISYHDVESFIAIYRYISHITHH